MGHDYFTIRLNDSTYNRRRCGRPRWTGGRTGQGVRMLETWFTCGIFKSWADDSLMERLYSDKVVTRRTKKVLVERARSVYYCQTDGRFYEAERKRNTEREGEYAGFRPITGYVWTCRPAYQQRFGLPDAEIICSEGYPTTVRIGDDAFTVTNDSWPMMESFLGLDESYKQKGADHDAA